MNVVHEKCMSDRQLDIDSCQYCSLLSHCHVIKYCVGKRIQFYTTGFYSVNVSAKPNICCSRVYYYGSFGLGLKIIFNLQTNVNGRLRHQKVKNFRKQNVLCVRWNNCIHKSRSPWQILIINKIIKQL